MFKEIITEKSQIMMKNIKAMKLFGRILQRYIHVNFNLSRQRMCEHQEGT